MNSQCDSQRAQAPVGEPPEGRRADRTRIYLRLLAASEEQRRGSARSARGDWHIAAPRWWSLVIRPCVLKLGIGVMLRGSLVVESSHRRTEAPPSPASVRASAVPPVRPSP